MKDRGLVGLTTEEKELKKVVVRVGAPEYEPNDHIKGFTLQSRIREIVVAEKIEKLEEQLKQAQKLLSLVKNRKLKYQYKPTKNSDPRNRKGANQNYNPPI